jgi:hypothetical protein
MIHVNVLELVRYDPSRLTADLAGRTPHPAGERHPARAVRRSGRPILRRRRMTAH